MKSYSHISCEALHEQRDEWTVVDIRDPQAFSLSRVDNSIALNNENLSDFLAQTEANQKVAVMCYHGHSSQQAAEYLASQGLKNVASVDGGFEFWRLHFPVDGE
ncbi:thiosulfate sulfurtransferase GlpE [Alteromonas sp. 5E99-2]|uniref:thiosulfate sulfurtransferase GlpE n=1 Tax=Alteromonas sp. 5E99-2 TaxID=2817683 RepID=UPI001A98A7C3|nr:thiosulfate sulfurtransferase GlpE [Alteromonas sp. 5E99-2]MBO1257037.1 thiosulfate sulfurtransferase GlpE [Alteromonas sp. 5E99-2]